MSGSHAKAAFGVLLCTDLAEQAYCEVLAFYEREGFPLPDSGQLAETVAEQFRELLYVHLRARGDGPYYLVRADGGDGPTYLEPEAQP